MDELKGLVKTFLDIQTDAYDIKLEMLIPAARSKLKNEGVPHFEKNKDNSDMYMDYAVCVACQVAKDIDIDVDMDKLDRLYISRLIPLKEALRNAKTS